MTGPLPSVAGPRGLTERLDGILAGAERVELVHRCGGGCDATVAARGATCSACAERQLAEYRLAVLARAYASVSPQDTFAWARHKHADYPAAVADGVAACATLPDWLRGVGESFFRQGSWPGKSVTLTLLGPTGLGKTTACIAFAHRLLDRARDGGATPEQFAIARRIRFTTGLELARARAEEKLGREAPLVAMAARARLLILDEIGYENQRLDPDAIRDIVHARRRHGGITLFTSGKTRKELEHVYGAALVRRLEDLGVVIDLHGGAR